MKKFLICAVLFAVGLSLQAQNLYVQLVDAEQLAFPLADKPTITFGSGTMTVNETAFQLSNVQNFSFTFNPDAPTSIEIPDLEGNRIIFFPNPVQDELTLIVEKETQGLNYRILDLNGRTVRTGQIQAQQTAINMQNLRTGTYVFNVEQNGQLIQSFKIIKH
jgi:hypothetical protein